MKDFSVAVPPSLKKKKKRERMPFGGEQPQDRRGPAKRREKLGFAQNHGRGSAVDFREGSDALAL